MSKDTDKLKLLGEVGNAIHLIVLLWCKVPRDLYSVHFLDHRSLSLHVVVILKFPLSTLSRT